MSDNTPAWQQWWQQQQRDVRVFRRLFPWRISAIFFIGIAGLAAIYRQAHITWESDLSYVKSIYAVLNMLAFQVSFADMPQSEQLDIFFVLIPLLGLPLLLVFGANILNVIRVFFVRRERGQRWQMALADTIQSPIIVCGLGRVGYRVASQLLDMNRSVIGIEAVASPLVDALIERHMPVILGDVRNVEVLRSAGIERASRVIVCTHDDLANIEAAFHTRAQNTQASLVLRLFEDEIAAEIKTSFAIKAIISRSAIAAQTFAHAALGLEVLETFGLNGQTYVLAEIPLARNIEQNVQQLATTQDITIICLYRHNHLIIEPPPATPLQRGDTLYVFAALQQLTHLHALSNLKPPPHTPSLKEATCQRILVCGIGHAGYRVVQALRRLHCDVVALDFEANRLAERLREAGVPVHYGDFRQRTFLQQVGIRTADAIITCTENDMRNLETGLRARELAPDIRIIVRIFEEALGEHLQQTFAIDAVYSTSAIAAPAFVSAALNIHLAQPVNVGHRQQIIARLAITPSLHQSHQHIAALNAEDDLTVLLHKSNAGIHVPPDPDKSLLPNDEIVVLASPEKLQALNLKNQGTI